MREIESCKPWEVALTIHQCHSLRMRDAGRETLLCVARHPKTAHTFAYEVCVLRCDRCQTHTKLVKAEGYLPVKVQRISRGAEAATPAAAHALPDGTSS